MKNKGFIGILAVIAVAVISVASFGFYANYKINQAVEQIEKENLGATILTTDLSNTIGTFRTNVNTSLTNLNAQLTDSTSTDPGHKHTTSTILYLATTTWNVAQGGTATTTFIRGLVTASGTTAFGSISPSATGQIPMASGTQFVTGNLVAGSNMVITTSTTGQITLAAGTKFSGTGADGALSITQGTTTIDLVNAQVFVKNYSSISITGTSSLAFSNPATNGTIIILKSTGNITITSTSGSAIDVRNLGSTSNSFYWVSDRTLVGTAGANGGANLNGGGGGGGSSAVSDGIVGTAGDAAGGAGGVAPVGYSSSSIPYFKYYMLPSAAGGTGGYGNINQGTVGTGGRGSGALWIETGAALNFTGTINAQGGAGTDGSGWGGSAGGGGGGSVAIFYTTLTATGTINIAGGLGGTAGADGGVGGTGFSKVIANTEF